MNVIDSNVCLLNSSETEFSNSIVLFEPPKRLTTFSLAFCIASASETSHYSIFLRTKFTAAEFGGVTDKGGVIVYGKRRLTGQYTPTFKTEQIPKLLMITCSVCNVF